MRVHSNEFRGSQSSYRTPLYNTRCASPGSTRHNRYSQPINEAPPIFPCFTSSPCNTPPDVPPPLPSPRNRVKAVPPPLAPSISSASHRLSKTLPRNHSPQTPTDVQSRQLPMIPGLTSSSSDPTLDIDTRPPAPLPNSVRIIG